tara:strand:- start:628 stop:1512 length:885 start_codon:yes stop_codon:yes gene_type:complete
MTIRSNENRLGIDEGLLEHQAEAPPLPAAAAQQAPAQLNFVIPTEFVELPSKGEFYSSQHPLHNKETVEIRHMTAKDEDILTSRTLLKQGVALDRMLQNILVDKSIRVKDLLLGDKNALIVSARINGYGAEYATKINCPACETVITYKFDLNSLEVDHSLQDIMAHYDVTKTEDNTFLLPLPKTAYTVELKLLTGHDETRLTELSKRRKKHKFAESGTTDQLKAVILSVNGHTDRAIINQFVDSIPALDSRYLRKVYEKLMPNLDLTHKFDCEECGHMTELEVPFTTDFFWTNN